MPVPSVLRESSEKANLSTVLTLLPVQPPQKYPAVPLFAMPAVDDLADDKPVLKVDRESSEKAYLSTVAVLGE